MPTYRLTHRTVYEYEDPVPLSQNIAHLLPRAVPWQRWGRGDPELSISPTPAFRGERVDYFGNRVTFFEVQEPHTRLAVTSGGRVTVEPVPAPEGPGMAWELAGATVASDHTPAGLDAYQFAFDSPFVRRSDALLAYAAPSFAPGRGIIDAATDLMSRIHTDFRFDPKATTAATPLEDVMRLRRGVCQDFAHLMVGALRSVGLAARYVSGYILTVPAPGQPRLAGADASHAWASVFVPSADGQPGTWLDLDPTNRRPLSEQHITVAFGRDYGDVSPLQGVILGGARRRLTVSVDVVPV